MEVYIIFTGKFSNMEQKKILFISSWFPDRITISNGDFVKRHAQAAAVNNLVLALFVKHDPGMSEKVEVIESKEGNYHEVQKSSQTN